MTGFRSTIAALLLTMMLSSCAHNQGLTDRENSNAAAVLVADEKVVQVRRADGGELHPWRLAEEPDPDILGVEIQPGQTRRVCFFSGERSLCRSVGIGDEVDFTIRFEGRDYPTRIVGKPPAAIFDEAYREAHRGEVSVEIPEVYELVNVAIALTPLTRDENDYKVQKKIPYYGEVLEHFSLVENHPLVQWLDRELRNGMYSQHKMSAYSFVFGSNDQIVRSPIYNSTNFNGRDNTLLPVTNLLQSFADESEFRGFYRAHRDFYRDQAAGIREGLDIEGMLEWLKTRFPDITPYDHVNIIVSPLVHGSQSVTWFRYEGFSELQPHVNYPYAHRRNRDLSSEAIDLERRGTLFTELNHGFINPTAVPYRSQIAQAMKNRKYWAGENTSSYGWPEGVFNEMMNWALFSLYYVDTAPPADLEGLIDSNVGFQVSRGFKRAPEFHEFLVGLYRNRPAGTTIADLYPQIVAWFGAQNEQE